MISIHFNPAGKCVKITGLGLSSKGMFILPFDLPPVEGEHNLNTCSNCQEQLARLTKVFIARLEGKHKEGAKPFPYCCADHEKLITLKEFNRADFIRVPEMSAKKIIYTAQLIGNSHSSENWYKVITDYIELAVESFGQMPDDCGGPLYLGDYFNCVTDFLKQIEEVPTEKKTRLLEFFNAYKAPNEPAETNFNILMNTYQKWLKEFPFELNSYFGHLKKHFETTLPLLNGNPEANIHSSLIKAKMHTKSSLIEALINLTNSLLTRINGLTLYEKGLITDANKIKLELVISSRKLKLIQGYNNSSPNEEKRYRKILKEWFKDEKRFIDEITPLLKSLPSKQIETKGEQEQPRTFEELFYNPEHAEICLSILKELQPPAIDGINNYICKAKGIFPLWVKVLKNHKPEPLIKHFTDNVYRDLLNDKIKGLNLSKDASEFRKQYRRLENDKVGLDIKTILSQFSQSGKLGR